MAALVSPDDELLLRQVEQLASQGAAGALGLLNMFTCRSWTVRRGIVAALSRGDAATLTLLVRSLVDARNHEPTVAGIVDALSGASLPLGSLLTELLTSTALPVLCDAIQICGRRQERACVPRLIELSGHADDNVALAAVEALGRIATPEAAERLIALVEGNNFFRVFPAIDALGRARESRALPALQKLLQQPLYAAEAARALGRIGQLVALGPLVKAMTSGPESLLRVAAQSLVAIQDLAAQSVGVTSVVSRAVREHAGPTLREKVARALSSADGSEAVALGRILVWLANEDSVDDFVALLGGAADVSVLAIEGLSRLSALGDPRVVEALAKGSSDVRARLLPALMGISAATRAVVACLDDEQASVRAMACHVLARDKDTTAVPRLFRLLTDPDLGVVHAAVGAIQSLGSTETERLALGAARSADPAERRAGLRIVTYFGYDGALELCVEALGSDDERMRDIALAGLPALDEPNAASAVLAATNHPSARTRASALRALSHLTATAEAVDRMRAALGDADPWVRYYACQSLGRLGVVAALSSIVTMLDDPAGQVKVAAVEALAAIPSDEAKAGLLRATASTNADVQRAAIVGIGERRDPELRPAVLAALSSADGAVRLVAISSIARFEAAEPELVRAASADEDIEVRRAALELLAVREGNAATEALLGLLEQEPGRNDVAAALAQRVEQRIPVLLAHLEKADDTQARALLAVLSSADSRQARAALDTAFASRNPSARRAAARVFSLLLDDGARVSLARSAAMDSDPEVRRICALSLA